MVMRTAAGMDSMTMPTDPVPDLPGPPGGPGRGAGRAGVGLGQRRQQVQGRHVPDRLDDRGDGGRVVRVAAGGEVAEQQVVPDQPLDRPDVRLAQAHPAQPGHAQVGPDHGVVGVVAFVLAGSLADVVQDRGQQQQVRSGDPADQAGGVHRGLHQVPVDRVEVDRVALRQRAQPLPAGQQGGDQAGLVQVLPGGEHRLARSEQGQERIERDRRPRVGQRRAGAGQPQHGGRRHRQPGLRGGGRRPHHQRGIVGRVDRSGQHRLALLLDDAVGQRGAFDAASDPAAQVGDGARRPGQRPVHPVPGQVAGVVDRAGDPGDVLEQGVPVVEPQ
jgi:hypothetical protein